MFVHVPFVLLATKKNAEMPPEPVAESEAKKPKTEVAPPPPGPAPSITELGEIGAAGHKLRLVGGQLILESAGKGRLGPQTELLRIREGRLDNKGPLAFKFETGRESIFILEKDKTLKALPLRDAIRDYSVLKLAKHSEWTKQGVPPARFTPQSGKSFFAPSIAQEEQAIKAAQTSSSVAVRWILKVAGTELTPYGVVLVTTKQCILKPGANAL